MAHVIDGSERGGPRRQARRRGAKACVVAVLLGACDSPSADDGRVPSIDTAAAAPQLDGSSDAAPSASAPVAAAAPLAAAPPPEHGVPSSPGRVLAKGAATALERATIAREAAAPALTEHRRADRAMMIYAAPRFDATFRGKLPHGGVFGVLDRAEVVDAECRGDGWARVGPHAFVCLEHTSKSDAKPRILPSLGAGRITPYIYARVRRKGAAAEAPAAPRWSSRSALAAGAEPIDFLQPDHDYAFEQRKPSRHGYLLVDAQKRVVREADVRRLEPSTFAGRDLVADPLPESGQLAWSVMWPSASIRAEPRADSAIVSAVPHQAQLFVTDAPVQHRGVAWVPVAGDAAGYVDASEIRRWFPATPPTGLAHEELWIDVELEQQTLAVMLGDAPLFVTMIASGNHKHPTPQGVYRIKSKMAVATMDSQPGDDEAYSVESVPWAQFFYKRYGLHGTFWHNRFGKRTSHGCVNLSAKDAALVYAMTTPATVPGWVMSFAHDLVPGTVVRVRKLDADVPDRRADPVAVAIVE